MIEELFDVDTIKWALIHEGPILRVAHPSWDRDTYLHKTMMAENCRYIDVYTQRKEFWTEKTVTNRWRIILREGTEEAIINELEDIGLVEVPKGAEDPEDLKRVWVR
jgi:hypothetical protein